jgi:NAD(P)-dependent dehydrogenase (short-subunit alcohol dehydrogenase family)
VTKAGVATLARELADEWENRPHLRINAVVPGPIRSPLRGRTHPGEDRAALPLPEALVPLYLHLLSGQGKADSGQLFDAQAWLAGTPCATALRA